MDNSVDDSCFKTCMLKYKNTLQAEPATLAEPPNTRHLCSGPESNALKCTKMEITTTESDISLLIEKIKTILQ